MPLKTVMLNANLHINIQLRNVISTYNLEKTSYCLKDERRKYKYYNPAHVYTKDEEASDEYGAKSTK